MAVPALVSWGAKSLVISDAPDGCWELADCVAGGTTKARRLRWQIRLPKIILHNWCVLKKVFENAEHSAKENVRRSVQGHASNRRWCIPPLIHPSLPQSAASDLENVSKNRDRAHILRRSADTNLKRGSRDLDRGFDQ